MTRVGQGDVVSIDGEYVIVVLVGGGCDAESTDGDFVAAVIGAVAVAVAAGD